MQQLSSLKQEMIATQQQVVFFYDQDFQKQIDRLRGIMNRNLRSPSGDIPHSARDEAEALEINNRVPDIFIDRDSNPDPHNESPQRVVLRQDD